MRHMHTYTHTYTKGGTGGVEMAVYALHRHALERPPFLTLSLSPTHTHTHTHESWHIYPYHDSFIHMSIVTHLKGMHIHARVL